jgi:hypothetical protein
MAAKGRENIRDTEFRNMSSQEIIEGARDKTKSAEERRRFANEEKARGLRNRAKRGWKGKL